MNKSYKEILFTIAKYLSVIAVSAILGFLLLLVAYKLPVGRMRHNIRESAGFLADVGDHDRWNGTYAFYSEIDYFTDSLMLSTAVYNGDGTVLDKSLRNLRVDFNDIPEKSDDLVADLKLSKEESAKSVVRYPRYWHGYLIILKPLLMVLNYNEIRLLLCIIHFVSVVALSVLLYEKSGWFGTLIFALSIIIINPISVMQCIQFSVCPFIYYLGMLALVLMSGNKNEDRERTNRKIYVLFLTMGILTAYFDLLTFPLFTAGMLVIFAALFDTADNASVVITIKRLLCWGYGYAGMWFMKWILASALTEDNVLKDAIERILLRSSSSVEMSGETVRVSLFSVIGKNNGVITDNNVFWALLLIIAILIAVIVWRRRRLFVLPKETVISLLIVIVLPFIWLAATRNHSSMHFWMTYRILAVAYCGAASLFYPIGGK